MSSITRLRPPGLYPGAPYAYASVVPPGHLVFAAGACPLDEGGTIVSPGDLESQTERAVRNLFTALAAAGSSKEDVLKTTIFVATTERSELVRAWNVVKAAFGAVDPPGTLLGVAALGYPDQLVEIEAVAAVPDGASVPPPRVK
jgi:enamine deaminase RidA (YjgF/YER057c/UK114 family)